MPEVVDPTVGDPGRSKSRCPFAMTEPLELAALTLSFEKQSAHELQREYASAAWALEDVHKRDPAIPLAVVMRPPASGTSKTYDQARHVFGALKARPVSQPELDDWAAEVAESIIESTTGS